MIASITKTSIVVVKTTVITKTSIVVVKSIVVTFATSSSLIRISTSSTSLIRKTFDVEIENWHS